MKRKKQLQNIFKEPLLQFILIGLFLFVIVKPYFSAHEQNADQSIHISIEDKAALAQSWHQKWNRPPSAQELENAVELEIRKRIFFREAQKLNLEEDDLIIQRRMIQKLEYIQEALALSSEPNEQNLAFWYKENTDTYKIANTYKFEHIFFDTDKHKNAYQIAESVLLELRENTSSNTPSTFAVEPASETILSLQRKWGKAFAQSLATQPVNTWTGPIRSGLGVHLVKVNSVSKGTTPPLEHIKQRVINDFMYELRNKVLTDYYQTTKKHYSVTIAEGSPKKN